MKRSDSLAGIIPIYGYSEELTKFVPSCLAAIKENHTILEQAVENCITVGCRTIWIVVEKTQALLLKECIGARYFDKKSRKNIPIYWCTIDGDYTRSGKYRKSVEWSVIYGFSMCEFVHQSYSRWAVPRKYFIMFPYTMFDGRILGRRRFEILTSDNTLFFTYREQSVRDDKKFPFVTTIYQMRKLRENYKYFNVLRSEFEKKFGGDFSNLFASIDKEEDDVYIECEWMKEVQTWKKWIEFLYYRYVGDRVNDENEFEET